MADDKKTYAALPKDAVDYEAGYRMLLERSDFRDAEMRGVERVLGAMPRERGAKHSLLDIGCGDGDMTAKFFKTLKRTVKARPSSVTLVEPAAQSLTEAKKRLAKHWRKIWIDTVNRPAEEFMLSLENSRRKFDWILGFDVFYHADTAILEPLLRRLSWRGHLLMTMVSPKNALLDHPALRALVKHGDSRRLRIALESPEVREGMMIEEFPLEAKLDIRGLVDSAGAPTPEGEIFFSFIYNRDVRNFSGEQARAMRETLAGVLERHGGLAPHEYDLFVVSRAPVRYLN